MLSDILERLLNMTFAFASGGMAGHVIVEASVHDSDD